RTHRYLPSFPTRRSSDLLVHSDRFIEDGSYLRLKNIALAYNLPIQKWFSNNWFRKMQVYVNAQNIFTITSYSGIDPEVNSLGSGDRKSTRLNSSHVKISY